MTQAHELRCYDYVNQPYELVSDALLAGPREIFARATKGVANRAEGLPAKLHANVGPFDIGADIHVDVLGLEEKPREAGKPEVTTIRLAWRGAHAAGAFPTMEAELKAYPLTPGETQLEIHGVYRPPLGPVGDAVDAIVGQKVAEASVQRFVSDIASLLRSELAED